MELTADSALTVIMIGVWMVMVGVTTTLSEEAFDAPVSAIRPATIDPPKETCGAIAAYNCDRRMRSLSQMSDPTDWMQRAREARFNRLSKIQTEIFATQDTQVDTIGSSRQLLMRSQVSGSSPP